MGLAAVFLLAALLTWAARGYALRRNLFDQPGERRSHQVATPRGGGIAIVISQMVAYAVIGVVRDELAVALALFSTGLLLVPASAGGTITGRCPPGSGCACM